ncbi:MAG: IS1595 family transposase [Desulfohalobiaceae bacterium]
MHLSQKRRRFRKKFSTELDCINYLLQQKWPQGFVCPRCAHSRASVLSTRRQLYQCKGCRYQASVTANTIFHRTQKPLQDWFWAIFLVANLNGHYSALQLKKELGISYPTAWHWRHKIQKAIQDQHLCRALKGIIELDGDAWF